MVEEHYKLGPVTPYLFNIQILIRWKNITNWGQ